MSTSRHPLIPEIQAALERVDDPEIRRPITELGMVDSIEVDDDQRVLVRLLLTVPGCPMKERLTADVERALAAVPGVASTRVELSVMDDEQRAALRETLTGGRGGPEIPFARPDNRTRVVAVASGKGGVGKSSLTVNLACALAAAGERVGLLDADIYGHSVPDMLGLGDARPTLVDDMIMPVPAHGVGVISMGMLKQRRDQVVAWRGPILDRALTQLLSEVFWGDLDFLLLDLPPGTGDVPMSLGQKLPGSEVLVVTTPQDAAAEVAERAGSMAHMMRQRVLGVVENMSWLERACPHCGEVDKIELFGSGGGAEVAARLSARLGEPTPLLARIPFDDAIRHGGDQGAPSVLSTPDHPASRAVRELADHLIETKPSLVGRRLPIA